MSKLSDVSDKALRELLGTRCLSSSTVNLQDATATFDSVTEPDAKIVYEIDGLKYEAADVTNEALVTLAALQNPITGLDGYYSQPVSTTVYYVWVKNAAGTDYVIQGTYAGQVINRAGRNGLGDGSIPDIAVAATYAPIAIFRVVNGVTAVWIPGTTNWNATNVDAYAQAVGCLPAAASVTGTIGGA